jgi:hypothetical protein
LAFASLAFAPHDVGPMRGKSTTDGVWKAVSVANDGGNTILFETTLHPDLNRPLSDLHIVAIDLAHARLHAIAGAVDPDADVAAAKGAARPAVVPAAMQPMLLAAFNGGWKTDHGHYGMKVDGVVLVPPKETCTIAGYTDDTIRIGGWSKLAAEEPKMGFYRQTPPCLYAGGVRNTGLSNELTTSWGANETGDPVIRRSAIGLDEHGTTLFVAVGNALTAPALADAMRFAGAFDVAELDVNWSYPKFLVYRANASGALDASTLFPTYVFDKDEYIRRRSTKDFFYLERR